jgi:hypothetical protein
MARTTCGRTWTGRSPRRPDSDPPTPASKFCPDAIQPCELRVDGYAVAAHRFFPDDVGPHAERAWQVIESTRDKRAVDPGQVQP